MEQIRVIRATIYSAIVLLSVLFSLARADVYNVTVSCKDKKPRTGTLKTDLNISNWRIAECRPYGPGTSVGKLEIPSFVLKLDDSIYHLDHPTAEFFYRNSQNPCDASVLYMTSAFPYLVEEGTGAILGGTESERARVRNALFPKTFTWSRAGSACTLKINEN